MGIGSNKRIGMHVGIVLHPFGNAAKGLEQYVYESSRSMIECGKDVTFRVFVKGNPDTSKFGNGVTVVNLPDTIFWKFSLLKWSKRCDVFVFFTESAPIFLWKQSIIVFFDAAYYYFYEASMYAKIQRNILVWWRGHMMRTVRHVVTISEASKKDLVEKFFVPADHSTVIYPGFKSFNKSVGKKTEVPSEPYFIYVGPIKERKNVLGIIEAFDIFRKKSDLSFKLLLVGRKTEGNYEGKVYDRISASPFNNSIIFKNFVSDEMLMDLYVGANALIFPSLLEGFGLPVLEALSMRCVVITSKTTSTKEALGDAGFLVDPDNSEEIADAMSCVAGGDYNKEESIKRGHSQVAKFSWQKSGESWNLLFKTKAQ